jgi:hypothetical protein
VSTLSINEPPFATNYWPTQSTNLPNGYLLPKATDFDGNGQPEIFLNQYDNGAYGDVHIFEWTGSGFEDLPYSYGLMIPQDIGDYDQDGLLEFLGRAFNNTYLFEQQSPHGFPDTLIWRDTTGFHACALLDLNPNDGHTEFLAWRDYDGKERYGLYRMDPGPNPVFMDTLPNPTEGGNALGPPYVLIGDMDNDGLKDFLYGDYDGDVIFCELQSDGSVTAPWHFRLPYEDATTWLASGDADGDGQSEFIAGSYYLGEGGSESQIRARHWEYLIFHLASNDSFVPVDTVAILGAEDPGDYEACVCAGDIDGDGRAEFLLSAYPDLYVIKYDPAAQQYAPAAYFTPSESNAILVSDWNHNGVNEYLYCDGQDWQRGEAEAAAGTNPMPPVGLTGEPLGPHEIFLSWQAVTGANMYRVWKGETPDDLDVSLQTTETMAEISQLPENVEYLYAVTAIDHDSSRSESAFSAFVRVTANQAPTVEHEATYVPPHFVRVRFSEAMDPSILEQRFYHLDDGRMPGTITTAEGERVAYLEFDGGFQPGDYRMTLSGLRDSQKSLLPADSGWVEFTVLEPSPTGPYISAVEILSPTSFELTYSEPMSESVLDIARYRMTPVGEVVSLESLTPEHTILRLSLDERWPIGAVGRSLTLHVTNVFSEEGIALDSSNGVALLEAIAPSLDDVYVYPNPYKGIGANGTNCVMFAGLTRNAKVYIFSLEGRKLKTLEGVNSAGGLSWCLDNDEGDQVASGIYLYTVTDGAQTRRGKLAVLR